MAGLEHDVRPVSRGRRLLRLPVRATRKAMRAGTARPRLTLAVWGVILVVLAGGTGWLWWQDHQHDRTAAARAEAVEAVDKTLGKTLSYKADTVDEDLATAQANLTGAFKEEFGNLAADVVAPAAKRDKISTTAKVTRTAVVSATPDDVVVLAYVNQTTESKSLKEPRKDNGRMRVSLSKVDDRWLVSDLRPV